MLRRNHFKKMHVSQNGIFRQQFFSKFVPTTSAADRRIIKAYPEFPAHPSFRFPLAIRSETAGPAADGHFLHGTSAYRAGLSGAAVCAQSGNVAVILPLARQIFLRGHLIGAYAPGNDFRDLFGQPFPVVISERGALCSGIDPRGE